MNFTAPVKLCDLEFSERGLPAAMRDGMVSVLPTATSEQVSAVIDFLGTAVPCTHVFVSEPQKCASDEWAALNAKLAAIPAGADYDAIRARYTAAVLAALDKATDSGGLA